MSAEPSPDEIAWLASQDQAAGRASDQEIFEGLSAGTAQANGAHTRPGRGAAPPPEEDGARFVESRFAARLAARLPRVSTRAELWFSWDGTAWKEQESSAPFLRIALETLPPYIRTERRARAILAHVAAQAQSSAPFNGAARFEHDGGPVLLNLCNGILRVEGTKARLLPHDPARRFSRTLAASWDRNAAAPVFEETLAIALPDRADRELLQVWAGHVLLPDARLESALCCYGPSGTGKSTIVQNGVAEALGRSVCESLSFSQLADPQGYSLHKLEGALLNVCAESEAHELPDSSAFKRIVSGEPIEARRIYGHPRTITPTAKLLFLTNSLPRFANATDAELRRLRFLNFAHRPAVPNPSLKGLICAERDGIFRWMLRGMVRALECSEMPLGGSQALATRRRFAISSDPLGQWLAMYCETGPTFKTEKEFAADHFRLFLESNGLSAANVEQWFPRKLRDRLPELRETRPHGGKRTLSGIRVAPFTEPTEPTEPGSTIFMQTGNAL